MDNDKKAGLILKIAGLAVASISAFLIGKFGIYDPIMYRNKLNNLDTIAKYIVKKGDGLDKIGIEQGYIPSWMLTEDWRNKTAEMNNRPHNPDSLVPSEELTVPVWYEVK